MPGSSAACWKEDVKNGRQQNWRCGRVSGDGRVIGMVTSLETRQGWFGDVNTCCTDTTISSPYGHAGQPFPPTQPERRPPTLCICCFPALSSPSAIVHRTSAAGPRIVCFAAAGRRLHSLPVHCAWRPIRLRGEAVGSMPWVRLDIIVLAFYISSV